jgi:hypothetical protein
MRILDGRDQETYKVEFVGESTVDVRISWKRETTFIETEHFFIDLAREIKINNTKILQIDSRECRILVRNFFRLL